MVTLSRRPDPVQPQVFAFFTGRLGPGITDLAAQERRMNFGLLQGGGLTGTQFNRVRLPGLSAGLKRWFARFRPL
jgi:hypothetical protein